LPEPAQATRIEQNSPAPTPANFADPVRDEAKPIDRAFVTQVSGLANAKAAVSAKSSDDSFETDDLAANVARLDHLESEQARLLQRADNFMNEFFTHSASTESPQESEIRPIEPELGRPLRERSLTPTDEKRVEPPLVTSQNTETPSLVIGELTVEVVSPAPNTGTPPQVIVVHGKQTRTSAAFTNRSFGLNQF
jgi:hypothetical protein